MLLWSSQVAGTLGAQASSVIYPLLILALTGSPAQAAWASALRILPYLVLVLPVGALIDRWDRRRVMLVCHVGRTLAVSSLPVALWFDALAVQQIYLVAVIEGSLHVFFNIAETAALPRVVAIEQLPQATAQNQAGFAAAAIAGPALGTWLYQAAGRAWPFVVDVIGHLAGVWAIARMRTSFAPAPASGERHLGREVAEGIRWLLRERLVRDIALLTSAWNFIAAAVPLLLIVLAKEQGASDAQIGLVFSIGGIGGIAGALIGGRIQRRFGFGTVVIGVLALHALLFPLIAASPGPLTLGLVYAAMALLGPVYNVVQFSYRIALIPDALQGRVNSSFRLVAHGLNPLGALLCGYLLEHAGSGWTLAFFSLAGFVLAAAAAADGPLRRAPRAARAGSG
jgi:predicted MFS family arabinose efflux permease